VLDVTHHLLVINKLKIIIFDNITFYSLAFVSYFNYLL